jgi:hypothetical protein
MLGQLQQKELGNKIQLLLSIHIGLYGDLASH